MYMYNTYVIALNQKNSPRKYKKIKTFFICCAQLMYGINYQAQKTLLLY